MAGDFRDENVPQFRLGFDYNHAIRSGHLEPSAHPRLNFRMRMPAGARHIHKCGDQAIEIQIGIERFLFGIAWTDEESAAAFLRND